MSFLKKSKFQKIMIVGPLLWVSLFVAIIFWEKRENWDTWGAQVSLLLFILLFLLYVTIVFSGDDNGSSNSSGGSDFGGDDGGGDGGDGGGGD